MNEPADVNRPPETTPAAKLSEEDMARVTEYLNLPHLRRERPPFRPWILMLVLTIIVVGMTILSLLYAAQHGDITR
ncbi:MAG TPA: DUF3094 family protein [Pseudomonadales bacterium]|nr:DUF3094 family protein [Pseudomonadales bacterium]